MHISSNVIINVSECEKIDMKCNKCPYKTFSTIADNSLCLTFILWENLKYNLKYSWIIFDVKIIIC